MEPRVVRRSHSGSQNFLFAGFHDVLDLQINNGANGEIAAAFMGQIAVLLFHESCGAGPDADVARKIFLGEQTRFDAVIEVMAVVGDFVGEIGDLRFEGGILRGEIGPLGRMIEGSVVLDQSFTDFPAQVEAGETGYFCSNSSTMRRLWRLCSKPPCFFISSLSTVSPLWPKGEWPRSWASAMAS